MSRLHPGVEILATAIDNMKRGDYLRYPEGRILFPVLTLLIVWATAWAFYRKRWRDKIDPLFGPPSSSCWRQLRQHQLHQHLH